MTTPDPGGRPSAAAITHARLDPAWRDAVETARRGHRDPGQGRAVKSSLSNLPLPRSPLIGRDDEVAAIQSLLLQAEVGLITLTGSGGIGKTRLALQVAANLLDHFVDGVYFVSLAPIRDPDLVCAAIAQTLGVREGAGRAVQESLQEYLRDKQLLLVLDNFEQVLAAAPLVSALLRACHRLKVLVTSRATLHLYDEQEFPVPPLALPDHNRLRTMEKDASVSTMEFAAIDLFCQRARAVKPEFVLTPANAADVAKICISLDGLPLAIELAAARIKVFAPSALLARLQQRLTLLTGGPHDLPARQRTLRDEIAWSYDLLTPAEQTLFRRLAVFVGGFTLEAAQAVCNAAGELGIDVLEGVASLADKNLVRQAPGADRESRFGMLETIREYGLERLAASGEAETIHRYHTKFFLALAEATEPDLLGARRTQTLARLEAELDNLRAALVWSQTTPRQEEANRAALGLQLAGALAWFAHFGNHANEARGWLVATLQRAIEPTAVRAKALWGAGLMAMILGDFPRARAELEESVALWRSIGNRHGLAVALRELGMTAFCQGDLIPARAYLEESVALCRTVDRPWDLALALNNLATTAALQRADATASTLFEEEIVLFQALDDAWGLAAAFVGLGCLAGQQGNYRTAQTHFTNALALRRNEIDKWNIAEALSLLGEALQRQGELGQAVICYHECLALLREINDKAGIALTLHDLGALAQTQGEAERAACLLAAAAGLRALTGGASYNTLTDPADYERAIATVRATLSEEVFATRWAEGQAMSLEQAIAYALTIPNIPEAATSASTEHPVVAHSSAPAGLTAREVEVLRLMVQGLPYLQIAERLVISRRTVNAHVTSIFSKLNVTSRAAATRFAIDHHLV
jgi:predicted ATPase/DNA-binding NarL/FixJ family response regulator